MQRALSYAALPVLRVTLPIVLTAPCFALAAALLLAWQGEAALVLRWTPLTLGMTHLVVLGFFTMTIVGALAFHLGGSREILGGVNAPLLTDIHATWGLVGWVIVLTATVSFQLIPMFHGTAAYPRLLETWLPPLVFALLSGWSAAKLVDAAWWALACEIGIGALLLHYVVATVAWLRRRKRKPDTGSRYWLVAMGSLLLAALLHFIPFGLVFDSPDTLPLLTGVLVIVGCAMSAVNGMLYKLVPFLVWHHLAHDGRLPRERVPKMSAVLGEAQAARQWRWHLAGLVLLALACLLPAVLARPAGLFLMVALLLLVRDLAGAVLLYLRLRRA